MAEGTGSGPALPITGGCLCGAVRLTIDAAPLAVRMCWCRLCQYLGAGNATVNAVFPAEAVKSEGEVRWTAQVADSGSHMKRGFCPACGTQIFSAAEERPHLMIVRVGTLDEPAIAAPQSIIWTDAAPGWACLDADLPHVAGQPGPVG
jgi:hypothetical protein